jgi:hypothetical protein
MIAHGSANVLREIPLALADYCGISACKAATSNYAAEVTAVANSLAARPASAVAEHNLAAALGDMGDAEEALAAVRRAFAKGGEYGIFEGRIASMAHPAVSEWLPPLACASTPTTATVH